MQHIITKLSFLFLLSFLSCSSYALQSDYDKPINILAKEQVADLNNNVLTFKGKVEVTQGTMKLNADVIEIKRDNNNNLKSIIATGSPVTFEQELEDRGLIKSKSQKLTYNPKTGQISLTGRASISQGNSHMSGEKIDYNIQTKQMRAHTNNEQGGRVSSTFIPAEFNK